MEKERKERARQVEAEEKKGLKWKRERTPRSCEKRSSREERERAG